MPSCISDDGVLRPNSLHTCRQSQRQYLLCALPTIITRRMIETLPYPSLHLCNVFGILRAIVPRSSAMKLWVWLSFVPVGSWLEICISGVVIRRVYVLHPRPSQIVVPRCCLICLHLRWTTRSFERQLTDGVKRLCPVVSPFFTHPFGGRQRRELFALRLKLRGRLRLAT